MSFWKRAKELYFNLKTTKASFYLSQPKMVMICPNSAHNRMFSAHDLWTANVCSTRNHNTPKNQRDILNNMKSLRGNCIILFVPYTSKSSLVIVNVIERLFSRQKFRFQSTKSLPLLWAKYQWNFARLLSNMARERYSTDKTWVTNCVTFLGTFSKSSEDFRRSPISDCIFYN